MRQLLSEYQASLLRHVLGLRRFQVDHRRNASHFGRPTLDCTGKRFSNRKGNENMKTKLSAVALVASAVTIAQANPGDVRAVAGGSHRGAVARSAPAVHAPMRPGGVSSFRSTPMRSPGSRPFYSGQRPSSFGMRSSPPPRTGGLSIRVEVRSRVPVHTR